MAPAAIGRGRAWSRVSSEAARDGLELRAPRRPGSVRSARDAGPARGYPSSPPLAAGGRGGGELIELSAFGSGAARR